MTITEFSRILSAKGYTKTEILKLNRLGFESASDAHEPMREDIPGDFNSFCYSIGRDFVIDNMDMFNEMIGR